MNVHNDKILGTQYTSNNSSNNPNAMTINNIYTENNTENANLLYEKIKKSTTQEKPIKIIPVQNMDRMIRDKNKKQGLRLKKKTSMNNYKSESRNNLKKGYDSSQIHHNEDHHVNDTSKDINYFNVDNFLNENEINFKI